MNPENYTEEQKKDINGRTEKARVFLKELQLRPAVVMQPINIGNDAFAMKPIVYLADEKFTPTASPLTP